MLFKRKRRGMREKGEERMERREEEKEEKVEGEKCERDPLHHSHDTFSVSCHSSDWRFSLSLSFRIQKREWVARTCLEKIQFNISINRKFFSFFSSFQVTSLWVNGMNSREEWNVRRMKEYLFDDEKRVKVSFLKILLNYNPFTQLFWNEMKEKEIAKQREQFLRSEWKNFGKKWKKNEEEWWWRKNEWIEEVLPFQSTLCLKILRFIRNERRGKETTKEGRMKKKEEYTQMLELLMNKWWKEWDEKRRMKIASRTKFSWERIRECIFSS